MLFALIALVASQVGDVRLVPGSQKVVRVPGLSRVAINSENVDVRVLGADELLVVAKSKGKAALTLWTPRGIETRSILVEDPHASEVERMVRSVVSANLTVEQYNGYSIIDGQLDSVDEYRRLMALVGDDPSVKVLARFNPRVIPVLADIITAQFQKNGLNQARAIAIGQKIFLEGSVADERELVKALTIAQAIYGDTANAMRRL